MPLLNFNRAPYFDDFDPTKNYLRVLFQSGRPVQARELNTVQSTLQNQVAQFANNIFKNGSIVSGGQSVMTGTAYVRLKTNAAGPSPYTGLPVNVEQFPEGSAVVGAVSGVTGAVITGVNAVGSDPATMYVVYTGTGIDGQQKTFIPGENVNFLDNNNNVIYTVTVRCPGCSTAGSESASEPPPIGKGQLFTVNEGVFYYNGFFISNPRQILIVQKYSLKKVDAQGNVIIDGTTHVDGTIPIPAMKIGLDFEQKVVTFEDDPSLLDPSLGYPNTTAPGADRYQVSLVLNKRGFSDSDGDDFIVLARVNSLGEIEYQALESQYASIMDQIAQRDFETNGNYTLSPFKIQFFESKKGSTTDAQGFAFDGSDDQIVAMVSPSIAYVSGFRVDIKTNTPVQIPKARSTKKINAGILNFPERTYIVLQLPGILDSAAPSPAYPNNKADASMFGYTVPNKLVLKDTTSTTIGYCYVNDLKYHGKDSTNTFHQYRYYIYGLTFLAGHTIDQVLTAANTTGSTFTATAIGADAISSANSTTNPFQLFNTNTTALVYELNQTNVKSLRDADNFANGSIDVVIRKKLTGVANSSGVVTFSAATNQAFLSANDRTIIMVYDNGGSYVGHIDEGGVVGFHSLSPQPASLGAVYSQTGTTMTVNLGDAVYASYNITVLADVQYVNQKELRKTLTNITEIWPPTSLGSANFDPTNPASTISLENLSSGPSEIYDVVDYKIFWTDTTGSIVRADVTSEYALQPNTDDVTYRSATFVRLVSAQTHAPDGTMVGGDEGSVVSSDKLHVQLDYYSAATTGEGWFDVDSYPVDPNTNPSASSNPVAYADLPTFQLTTKQLIKASNSIDFRPQVTNDPLAAGASPTQALLPACDTNAIFNVEYYLGRADSLLINKNGLIYSKLGIPSESPVPPKPDVDTMALYNIWFAPYTYSLNDVQPKFIENKRYTMRDIGKLESRIQNLEYYTSLNLLEQKAANMLVTDSGGLNRFKNGFIADSFTDYTAADLTNVEHECSTNFVTGEMRPQFKTRNHKLALDLANSTNVTLKNGVAMFSFTEEVGVTNPYATTHISVNPYMVYNQKGTMQVSPNNDTWSDTEQLPAVVTNIDTGTDLIKQLADKAKLTGTVWGSWTDQNSTIVGTNTHTTDHTNHNTFDNGVATTNTTTTTATTTTSSTTATNQTQTGIQTTIDTQTQSYDVNAVKDVKLIPYARSIPVEFYCQKMKPNTKVYAFYDQTAVSQYCRPLGTAFGVPDTTNQYTYGTQLITDANGELVGEFLIPDNTFFCGQHTLKISDDPSGNDNPDVETTNASGNFYSGGLDLTKQDQTLNIITPVLKQTQVTQNQTVYTTQTTSTSVTNVVSSTTTPDPPPDPPPPPPPAPPCPPNPCAGITDSTAMNQCMCAHFGVACGDPVAQEFQLVQDQFITSIDLYFKNIDPMFPALWLEIRETTNGYPVKDAIGRKDFQLSDLQAQVGTGNPVQSDDSTVAVNIKFDVPVFVAGGTTYCFVVGGFSPNSRIWESYLGQAVVNNPSQTVQSPPLGYTSFRSLNGSTWTAQQFETLKFNLYVANFSTGTMVLKWKMDAEARGVNWQLGIDPLMLKDGSNQVRVFARDHGFSAGDSVTLSLFDKTEIVYTPSGSTQPPQVGQLVGSGVLSGGHYDNGEGTIYNIQPGDTAGTFKVKLTNTLGSFVSPSGAVIPTISPALVKTVRSPEILQSSGTKLTLNTGWTYPQATGTLAVVGQQRTVGSSTYGVNTTFPVGDYGGIAITELNGSHTINLVDSQDSFIIQTTDPAVTAGRWGGTTAVLLNFNEKYDIFNVSGAYLTYTASEKWTLQGLMYDYNNPSPYNNTPYYGTDGTPSPASVFTPGSDRYLDKPQKIMSSNQASVDITAAFGNAATNTSPMINTDSFSITTISNRSEWIDPNLYTVQPAIVGSGSRFQLETTPDSGTETHKYVCQNVILANPASDLTVFFDVYLNQLADFDVYCKFLSQYSTKTLDDVPWIRADLITKSFSGDLTDRIEFSVTASNAITGFGTYPVYNVSTTDTAYQPADISGQSYAPFTAFKIKLVGRSKNSCQAPIFRAFRAIAVT